LILHLSEWRTKGNKNASDILQLQGKRSFNRIKELPAYEFESWVISALNTIMKEDPDFAKSKGLEFLHGKEIYSISSGSPTDRGFDFTMAQYL